MIYLSDGVAHVSHPLTHGVKLDRTDRARERIDPRSGRASAGGVVGWDSGRGAPLARGLLLYYWLMRRKPGDFRD
jgi:hypothetical protein